MNYRFILQFELRLLNFPFPPIPSFASDWTRSHYCRDFLLLFHFLFASYTTQKELMSVIPPSVGWLLGWMVGWMVVKVADLGAWALPALLPVGDWCWALGRARWGLFCWKLFWDLVDSPLSRIHSFHCCYSLSIVVGWRHPGSRAPLTLLLRSVEGLGSFVALHGQWLKLWGSTLVQSSPWIKGQGTSWNGSSSQASSS